MRTTVFKSYLVDDILMRAREKRKNIWNLERFWKK